MDPSYPTYPGGNDATPTPPTPPSLSPTPEPKKRWFLSKKKIIIAASIVLVIMGGIVAVSLGGGKNSKKDQTSLDSTIYIEREGYPTNKNSPIGDATALISEASGKVISFNGTPVIQPCGLITIADLRANKILLSANGLTGPVEQNTYSGQGVQKLAQLNESFADRFEHANTCQYYLEGQEGIIHLDVSQPFDSSAKGLQAEIDRYYQPSTDVEGFKAFLRKNNGTETNKNNDTYMIRGNNATVILRIKMEDTAKKQTLLKLVATRLKQSETTPMKSMVFSYKSPVMSNSVYNSCEILNDGNFKRVTGGEAIPLTKQEFASAIGIIIDDKGKEFNYASYHCSRIMSEDEGVGNMVLRTATYETDEMAKWMFQFEQTPLAKAKNVQQLSPALGDEAYSGDVSGMTNVVAVRKGRLIIHVTFNTSKVKSLTPEQRAATLRPVLEAEVSKLKGY